MFSRTLSKNNTINVSFFQYVLRAHWPCFGLRFSILATNMCVKWNKWKYFVNLYYIIHIHKYIIYVYSLLYRHIVWLMLCLPGWRPTQLPQSASISFQSYGLLFLVFAQYLIKASPILFSIHFASLPRVQKFIFFNNAIKKVIKNKKFNKQYAVYFCKLCANVSLTSYTHIYTYIFVICFVMWETHSNDKYKKPWTCW